MRKLKMNRVTSILVLGAIILVLSGCAKDEILTPAVTVAPQEQVTPDSLSKTDNNDYGEVVVQNGDRTLVFNKMPDKVITANMAATENMLLLGLKDYLVGRNVRTNPAEEPLPEIEADFYSVTEIERTHELAIANEAELMIGQISSFKEDTWGSFEMFEEKGVHCYVISGTVAEDETIENVYEDIEALGKIFKVEDRAEKLISDAKEIVAGVTAKTDGITENEKVKVFVMDSFKGNEIYTTSKGLQSNLIELAGGINVTRNMADSRWFNTSIETIVAANPDVIIFNDYGTQNIQEKIDFIKNNAALQDVPAVKNENFVIISLVQVMQDIRAASTCEFFANSFYPELFK
ncbi:lipoprotein [Anaerocolumna cellulosilytica]|uniref:Lipoprotein n=1 Tax=Anaerocolumna cellulosilytica TaxID=433286 RepID=A0A6S6R577_9FIRM|nr:ABC transporter substrate-binding protein [Anaerocolumna cellulosilytica]MBB5194218.1 iron complex transport system substrate-binding protein [Anaerocolumna cellulosilytica]BCJ94570.1 lipoprotein [Anaerocolumna cellulosilytica]